jgi:hypothetical protein
MQKNLSNSGKFLSSPISFLLIFLWLTNDHIWKAKFHNEITGKISDITGLIVFPFLLTAIGFIASYETIKEKTLFLFANLSIAILFSIINWNQDWNNWIYANCFGNQNGIADKTDLLCVPICLLTNFYFYKKYSAREISISTKIKYLHIISITLSTLAFINTSTAEKKVPSMHEEVNPNFPAIKVIKPYQYGYFFKGEETSFVWLTQGDYKEFGIYIFAPNGKLEKEILLRVSQLQKRFSKVYNSPYYIYSEEILLPAGRYEFSIIGSKDTDWKKEILAEQLYVAILEGQCLQLNVYCLPLNHINFGE